MSVFDPNIPSVRQLQIFVKDKIKVEVALITKDTLEGQLLWQDPNCICIQTKQEETIMIWLQSVVYIKEISTAK
jgi:host factor-I protein